MRELSLRLLLAVILCIGFGMLFGYIVTCISNGTILNFDNTIITFIQGLEAPWLTVIMKGFTWVGSGYVVAPIVLITLYILYYMLHYRHQAFLFVAVTGGTAVLNGLLKIYFKRQRPEIHRIMEASGFSFPSGHTMMTFSLYTIIAFIAWRNVKTASSHILLFLFSAFMIIMIGTSRIYVGVHYPSDVVGGVAASALWVVIAISVYIWYQERWEKKFTS